MLTRMRRVPLPTQHARPFLLLSSSVSRLSSRYFASNKDSSTVTSTPKATSPSFNQSNDSTRRRRKMKARIAGSLVGILITLYATYKLYDQYQREPLNSLVDKFIRFIKRGPYRDYITLHETSELVAGPIYVHSDPEVQFYLTIPNKFIRPGVVIRDNVDMRGVGGMVEILDQYGNYLSYDWIKLPQYEQHKLEDGRGDVLKEQVNSLLNTEKSNGYKVLAKERTKNPNQGIPDLFFIVEENPNSYENSKQSYFNKELKINLEPSNSEIIGRIIFTHKNRHLFVLSAKYPNSMLNLDLMKKELIRLGWTMAQIEQKLDFKFDTEDNNSRLFREMFEHATSDRNEIKEMLRQELLNQYMLDFKMESNSIPISEHDTNKNIDR